MPVSRTAGLLFITALVVANAACRRDPSETTTSTTGEFGGAGAGDKVRQSTWLS